MAQAQQQRQFPRLGFDAPGVLEARKGEHRETFQVSVRSISCEGAGVVLHSVWSPLLKRGATALLRFMTDNGKFEIPCRVAWHVADRDPRTSSCDVGLRLQLGLAPSSVRRHFAKWIVDQISARPDQLH